VRASQGERERERMGQGYSHGLVDQGNGHVSIPVLVNFRFFVIFLFIANRFI